MATKKTSMFTLTERLTISAATTDTFATIDLGSYVDAGDRQALQVHSVDFLFQGSNANQSSPATLGGSGLVTSQAHALNRGARVFPTPSACRAACIL